MHSPDGLTTRLFGPATRAALGLLLLALSSASARAEEWSFMGARYQGMGGAGVAVVDDVHAPYWNPGALAFGGEQGVALPIGVQAAAEGTILRDIDEVSNFLDTLSSGELDTLIDDLAMGNPIDAAQRATALQLLASRLPGLDRECCGTRRCPCSTESGWSIRCRIRSRTSPSAAQALAELF